MRRPWGGEHAHQLRGRLLVAGIDGQHRAQAVLRVREIVRGGAQLREVEQQRLVVRAQLVPPGRHPLGIGFIRQIVPAVERERGPAGRPVDAGQGRARRPLESRRARPVQHAAQQVQGGVQVPRGRRRLGVRPEEFTDLFAVQPVARHAQQAGEEGGRGAPHPPRRRDRPVALPHHETAQRPHAQRRPRAQRSGRGRWRGGIPVSLLHLSRGRGDVRLARRRGRAYGRLFAQVARAQPAALAPVGELIRPVTRPAGRAARARRLAAAPVLPAVGDMGVGGWHGRHRAGHGRLLGGVRAFPPAYHTCNALVAKENVSCCTRSGAATAPGRGRGAPAREICRTEEAWPTVVVDR